MTIADEISQCYNYQTVNTKDIEVDEWGQRDVEKRKSQFDKIMKHFNKYLVNELKLALIDGHYFCFDGQMTMKVLIAKNGGKHLPVDCKVYHGLTLFDISELFCDQGGIQSPVRPIDKIRVRAYYGDADCMGFLRATEKAGLDLAWSGYKSQNTITAVATAFKSYMQFKDKDRYADMLRSLKEAWPEDKHNVDAKILKGATMFYTTYETADPDRFATKLSVTRPVDLMRDAEVDRTKSERKYAVQMLHYYNRNARDVSRLPNVL